MNFNRIQRLATAFRCVIGALACFGYGLPATFLLLQTVAEKSEPEVYQIVGFVIGQLGVVLAIAAYAIYRRETER